MILSERRLAILAIAIGLLGVLPLLPWIAMLFEQTTLFLVLSPLIWPSASFFWALAFLAKGSSKIIDNAHFFFHFFIAPTLLLWGLLKIQRSERARNRIVIATCVLCAVTVPFALGLLLFMPLLLCVFVPMAIRFKNRDKAKGLGPGDGQAP